MVRSIICAFLATKTLFLPAPATATSVVALIDNTNHRVVIAADCRVNRQLVSLSECKIIEEPGCTVAMAGLYEEKSTAFHLRQLADAACRYPGDLRAKAEAFLRFAKIPYQRAVFGPTGAAARLGIPRSTLESKLKSLKIDRDRFKMNPES